MLTLAATRQVAILLDSIPPESRDRITLLSLGSGVPYAARQVRLESGPADATLQNSLLFRDLKHEIAVTVPATVVKHIWGTPDGDWFIAIAAQIHQLRPGLLGATPTTGGG